jgi:hypothetical protein
LTPGFDVQIIQQLFFGPPKNCEGQLETIAIGVLKLKENAFCMQANQNGGIAIS